MMIDYGCFIICLVVLCGSFFFLGVECEKIYITERRKNHEKKRVYILRKKLYSDRK